MKQTMKYLSMAALVAVGAIMMGCNKNEETLEPQQPEENTITMSITLNFGEDESTKALTDAGVKTFASGDKIAVIYKSSSATNKVVSDELTSGGGKSATFTITLSPSPDANSDIRIIYPAAMAKDVVTSDEINDENTINYAALDTQNGTLTTLAGNFDLCTFDGNLVGTNLPGSYPLTNRLAICKFTIKNNGGTDITSTITGLKVSDGTNTYTITRSAVAGPIWVAMRPISDKAISFSANDGTYYYDKSAPAKSLSAGSLYPINVTMNPWVGVDLGLTSGRIWANMNIGATSETDYGDLFAWGEKTGFSSGHSFDLTNYTLYTDHYTKYSDVDSNKTLLDAEDDAACANWGGPWRMPTQVEIAELVSETTSTWETDYKGSGIAGRTFTKNGKTIFLPAAGSKSSSAENQGTQGCYWTSDRYNSLYDYSHYLLFTSSDRYSDQTKERYHGLTIRPVREK